MARSIYLPLSGALMQEKRLDVLTNNLANVNTSGFKEDRPVFQAILTGAEESSSNVPSVRSVSHNPLSLSMYELNRTLVAFSGTKTDFSPGAIKKTGNPLDVAIVGDGFFSVETPQGVMYSRNGSLTISSNGDLVTQDGLPVLGQNGKISLEGDDISIGTDGTVLVDGNEVGKLKIVNFPRPYPLKKVGGSLFSLTTSGENGKVNTDVNVKQGFLELSNVNVVKEMVMMVEVNRAYQAYQKVIQGVFDTITRKAVNEVGRLT